MKYRSHKDGTPHPITPKTGASRRTFDAAKKENTARERLIAGRRARAFVGKETPTAEDLQSLNRVNESIMRERGTHYQVYPDVQAQVFSGLSQFNGIKDDRKRILSKAAWIAYAMSLERPYYNGNKRTASIATLRYLNANGYDVLVDLTDIGGEFYRSLIGVQKKRVHHEELLKFLEKRTSYL